MDYKIQALNGFQLYPDQIVTVFRSFYESDEKDLDVLTEITGLNRRKTRLLLNFLADLGLSEKRTFNRTKLGQLVYKEDVFFQDDGTLWLFHYMIASNEFIVVWNRILNYLYQIDEFEATDFDFLFVDLKDQISEYSYKKHIRQEISTVIKTYTETLLKSLDFIEEDYDGRYLVHRNPDIDDAILLVCIYQYREKFFKGATALPIGELISGNNGVARIFTIDEYSFREALERMKNRGWLTIESRGNLDQIRLQDGDHTVEYMKEYYSKRGS